MTPQRMFECASFIISIHKASKPDSDFVKSERIDTFKISCTKNPVPPVPTNDNGYEDNNSDNDNGDVTVMRITMVITSDD